MSIDPRRPRLGGMAQGRVTTTGTVGSSGGDRPRTRAGRVVRARRAPRAALLGAVLVTAAVTPVVAGAGSAQATPGGYTITEITALGQPAPGGGTFVNDFEPSAINSSGELGFTADVSTGGEGVFIAKNGTITQVMRSFMPAPGGVTTDYGELGRLGLNDGGDLVTGYLLSPQPSDNSGVFRWSHNRGLSAVAVPGQAMPGGGTLVAPG
jgi:hypothetical protein